jgi:DNA-binding LytR/AlgR family response regulator
MSGTFVPSVGSVCIQAGAAEFAGNERPSVALSPSPQAVILIVEDEFLIRAAAIEFAERAGFVVIEAENADAAIKILEVRNDIRVVFTDINMPGSMNGLRLARAIGDRWPPIKLIVASGRPLPSDEEFPENALFLPKPYDYDRVRAALSQAASA